MEDLAYNYPDDDDVWEFVPTQYSKPGDPLGQRAAIKYKGEIVARLNNSTGEIILV